MQRLDRFSQKYIPEPNSGCWLWLGTINADGYGSFSFRGRRTLAHRASLDLIGIAIAGLQVDHLCRVRCCVNPEHLEPVTPLENTLRAIRFRTPPEKTICAYGHDLAVVGSFLRKGRVTPACMECARISRRNYREITRPARRAAKFPFKPFPITCAWCGKPVAPNAARMRMHESETIRVSGKWLAHFHPKCGDALFDYCETRTKI